MKLVTLILLNLVLGSCGNKKNEAKEATNSNEKGIDRLLAQTGAYHKVGQCLLKTLVDPEKTTGEYPLQKTQQYYPSQESEVLDEECPKGSQVAAVISAYQEIEADGYSSSVKAGFVKYVWACYGSCEFSNDPK